ncbi:MAG TPA: hypothetical protein VJ793_18410 [Anaerolineae bacterium]|nr:hypothetical protein [Anaerolineae bacterium]
MEPEQLILIVGALLIGALLVLGGILAGLRGRRRSKSDHGRLPAAASGQAPKREPPYRMNEWPRKLPPDVVLLARDAATGEWVVEIEGQRYRRLGDVHDDKAAAKIVSAIDGLKAFAGLASKASPESTAPQRISVVSDPGPPVPPPTGPRRPKQATYSAPEGSIIAQIEQILQLELGRRPDLAIRSIHMGALPDGSLVVEVDGSFYRTPDEIPDAATREIVLRAVRTWETSS